MKLRTIVLILLPLVLIGIGVAGLRYLKSTAPKTEPRQIEERIWGVVTIPARRQQVAPEIAVFGEIVGGQTVTLRPLVAGRVVEVGRNFRDGAVVDTGALLLAIDRFDYQASLEEREAELAEAQAQLKETKAELTAEKDLLATSREGLSLRRSDLNRKVSLRKRGVGTQKSVDDARLAVNEAKQQVNLRQQTIMRLGARAERLEAAIKRTEVALRKAARDLEETVLRAPFAGFLADTDAAIGKRVSTGDAIARLIDANRLEVRFQLGGADFARLLAAPSPLAPMSRSRAVEPTMAASDGAASGASASGAVSDASQPSQPTAADNGLIGRQVVVEWRVGARSFTYRGHITRIGAEIDAASGGVDLYAELDDAGPDRPLRPGAFVRVRLPDIRYEDVIRLPEEALTPDDSIYVVGETRRLDVRQVTVLRRRGGEALIQASEKDLPPETRIVVSHFPEIGPGLLVAPDDSPAPAPAPPSAVPDAAPAATPEAGTPKTAPEAEASKAPADADADADADAAAVSPQPDAAAETEATAEESGS